MKKISFLAGVICFMTFISCNKHILPRNSFRDFSDKEIPVKKVKELVNIYQARILKNPAIAVLSINMSSDILYDMTLWTHAIRILPASYSKAKPDSTILIVEMYNKRNDPVFYYMSHFYKPTDTTSPNMRSRAVLCPQPPLCSVDMVPNPESK